MKLLDVARKDMLQSYRSLTGIMFMFVVPVLVTGLFYFMFGGLGGDDDFALPQTTVVIMNLDEGTLPAGADLGAGLPDDLRFDSDEAGSMGALLLQILQREDFADILAVSVAESEAAARTAVDNQEANVAIIIPANFTAALMVSGGTATIELYQDPTLTIGPAIVASIIAQFADNFSAATIGTGVVVEQLAEVNVPLEPELVQGVVAAFTGAVLAQQGGAPLVTASAPAGGSVASNQIAEILGQIMGGMMIFFVFFTGAGTLQSILVEEEKGTLARLFTTPTPIAMILGGKIAATLFMMTVQVTVLMLFGYLVFGINWGALGPVLLAGAGMVLMAAAMGLLLAALMRSTRQSGAVYGGVLTITGMLGMMSIFTGGAVSPTLEMVTLVVPQGWVVRGLQIAMQGGGVGDLLPTVAGLAVWILVFVAIGLYRLQRRFA